MRITKTWLAQLAILRALTHIDNVAKRTKDSWRWQNKDTAMPSLANPILAPLLSANLVAETDGRLALTDTGRARLMVEEKKERYKRTYSGHPAVELWHLVKCQCGHPVCDKHTVEGGGVFSTFYQGCGWSKADAQRICDTLNKHFWNQGEANVDSDKTSG